MLGLKIWKKLWCGSGKLLEEYISSYGRRCGFDDENEFIDMLELKRLLIVVLIV